MRCLYCDQEISKQTLYSLLINEDKLCINCRKQIKKKHQIIKLDDLEVECFYDYDSLFKSLLLQYKECMDEALSVIFLFKIKEYIELKYYGYCVVYMPSTYEKLSKRGFNHLEKIFEDLNLEHLQGLRYKEQLLQEGKRREEREKMINNFVYEGRQVDKVLIVDDVMTTGSSLKGANRALRPYTNDVKALVLASKSSK